MFEGVALVFQSNGLVLSLEREWSSFRVSVWISPERE